MNEHLNKNDLALILEVNKKAIEIETEITEQHETIITHLESLEKIEEKIDKLITQSNETNKDLFKIQVLFITGLLTLVVQIVQLFIKK
jgi:hypothetical protein